MGKVNSGMSLVKYCNQQYNLAEGCRTLRMGTLTDFREADPNFSFADPYEGIREIKGTGAISVNKLTNLSPNIIDSKGGSVITAENFNINNKELNCYVFCCSLPGGVFTGYNSAFQLPKAEILANILLNLLASQLTSADLEEPEHFFTDKGRLPLKVEHKKVNYFDSNALTFNSDTIDNVISNNKHDICFSKYKKLGSKNYAQEMEYRFCFFLFDRNGNQIAVKKAPKLLLLKPIPHSLHFLCKSFIPK